MKWILNVNWILSDKNITQINKAIIWGTVKSPVYLNLRIYREIVGNKPEDVEWVIVCVGL